MREFNSLTSTLILKRLNPSREESRPWCQAWRRSTPALADTRELIDVYPRGATKAVKALLYSATPDNPGFSAEMLTSESSAASIIGKARGPSGSNREYLLKMAEWLEEVGERDVHIETLVRLMPPE